MARRGTPQHVPPGTSSQARQSTAGRGWGEWVRWAVRACGTRVCLSGVAKAVPSPYHPKSRVPGLSGVAKAVPSPYHPKSRVPRDPGPLPTARCARCAAARRSRVPGSRSRNPNFSRSFASLGALTCSSSWFSCPKRRSQRLRQTGLRVASHSLGRIASRIASLARVSAASLRAQYGPAAAVASSDAQASERSFNAAIHLATDAMSAAAMAATTGEPPKPWSALQ